jgi:hypothetical protein
MAWYTTKDVRTARSMSPPDLSVDYRAGAPLPGSPTTTWQIT